MTYLACDLGAESGRLMSGEVGNGRINAQEIHRFSNGPLRRNGALHWDIPRLFDELKLGLRQAAASAKSFTSLSTDSWGVDYAFFHRNGALMEPVFHYRDSRTANGVARASAVLTAREIFDETGIQFMPLNTLYQLAAEEPDRLSRVGQMIPIADAFNFLLCGKAAAEESLASTTQLYNPRTRAWSAPLLQKLGLPQRIFPPIVPCGSRLAPLRRELACETGLAEIDVVASCSHDTAAAVVAVPAEGQKWAYISSGTWSLLGVELHSPIITEQCRQLNFTNEVGFGGTIRLLKNIVGLWIVQECRRSWAAEGQSFEYAQLANMAEASPPFGALIHPADARFLSPDEMPEKIAAFCKESGQHPPRNAGETVRCALESLALLYRHTLEDLETLTGGSIAVLHVVGGGSRNTLLNQFTANAAQVPVLAGPIEATTIGNVLVQAISANEIQSLQHGRAIVRASHQLQRYEPKESRLWDQAYERFRSLTYSQSGCE